MSVLLVCTGSVFFSVVKSVDQKIFSFFTKKTCDTAILESKTKMSGNDGSHNQRFKAEAEEFSVEMINDTAERCLKEKR